MLNAQVEAELTALGLNELLEDEDIEEATSPVHVGGSVDAKREAIARILAKYAESDPKKEARVERVLLSIADDEALTTAHVRPVQQVLDLLHKHFDPAASEKGFSLAISAGRNGARLSHNHATQYAYVEQSLMLWREILSHLSQMWSLAEADLIGGNAYRLRDTGQGVHRVQSAPHVGRFMQHMLGRMQETCKGGWVGSSAVHLGDNDVPNALVWIDKYTQIPRILSPLVQALEGLDELVASTPGAQAYVDAIFGSTEGCRKLILADFFRHGFDGSGADNFYDAGSCIDGRLTSAWNWCSKVAKKVRRRRPASQLASVGCCEAAATAYARAHVHSQPRTPTPTPLAVPSRSSRASPSPQPYFHVFRMAGFAGFDGSFSK